MDDILLQKIKNFKATEDFDKIKTMTKPVINRIVEQHLAADIKNNISSDEKTIRGNVTNTIMLQALLVPIVNDLYKDIMRAVIKYMDADNITKQTQKNTVTSVDISMIMTLAYMHKDNNSSTIFTKLLEVFKKHEHGQIHTQHATTLDSCDYIG